MIKRIGFACKYSQLTNNKITAIPELNVKTTTVAYLNRQTKQNAHDLLFKLVNHNLSSVYSLIDKVGSLDHNLRCVRLSSEILPLYTHPTYSDFYNDSTVQLALQVGFESIGVLARSKDVRLSFHPGQFVCLSSDRPDVVENSIAELEYHVHMAKLMGYGKQFQDFKVNIHISGKLGSDGIKQVYHRLSPEARNMVTIENEEMKHGLDSCLEVASLFPIVFDIHHHFVHSGEYMFHNDPRVGYILDSWRGVRPIMHYSMSREDVLVDHDTQTIPNFASLIESGLNKSKLRAHSDFYWNSAVNDLVLGFWDSFDIMCESKAKNLASFTLYNSWKNNATI